MMKNKNLNSIENKIIKNNLNNSMIDLVSESQSIKSFKVEPNLKASLSKC